MSWINYCVCLYICLSVCLDVSLSSDFIAGFCTETEADHDVSLDLIRRVNYNFVFCFPYSMRQVHVTVHVIVLYTTVLGVVYCGVTVLKLQLCCPHMWSRNKINSVLETIYFISAPDIRTCKAEIK